MFSRARIEYFEQLKTPFYFYDTGLLHKTLFAIKEAANLYNYHLHYAVKANTNEQILRTISGFGLGADCVSGNEIAFAIKNGFNPQKIVFAGVGKTNDEIEYSIDKNTLSLNCESIEELQVINRIARSQNKIVQVALRINPNVDANTHQKITTGLNSNKFGLSLSDLNFIITNLSNYKSLFVNGIHFHIGSQITDLNVFKNLSKRINAIQDLLKTHNIHIEHVNLGGGLGINYKEPDNQIPDFHSYFKIFNENLKLIPGQNVHIEPGRSVVGQCGILISQILYVKQNENRKTIIVDAGFTELLRPALYQAEHKIVNLTSNEEYELYDVAGPICETSDYFGRSVLLPKSKRGDLIAILSAGAYGEVMSSQYNLRSPARKYFSDEINCHNEQYFAKNLI